MPAQFMEWAAIHEVNGNLWDERKNVYNTLKTRLTNAESGFKINSPRVIKR